MSVVDEIKSRLDIVDVVGGYVPLKKAGRNYKALCPFHSEKTPSFTVNPERQAWHCFGACGTGGDVLSFVMRAERLDFGEAMTLLGERAGVALRERRRDSDRYDILYQINQESARFYRDVLASPNGKIAADYLAERRVDSGAVSTFELGMSPRGRDALKAHLAALGVSVDRAVEAGVLRRGEDGGVRDFFWGRLMYPIHGRRGRIAGFGARSLDGSDPKYINTAATPVFDKRATLYGLHLAAPHIRESETAIVVEGYMDAIAAHQHGYRNVVACMGTALTDRQVSQLKGLARNIVQALDPDAAGQDATLRSLESTYRVRDKQSGQKAEFSLSIALLPEGRDPDTLIRQEREAWDRCISEAVPWMEHYIRARASKYDLSTPSGKAQAADAVRPVITEAENAFEQERSLVLLAEVLGVSREVLEASIGRPAAARPARAGSRGRRSHEAASLSPLAGDKRDFLEDYLVALLLGWPELKQRIPDSAYEYFRRTENKQVFTCWASCTTIEELRVLLDESLHEHLDYLGSIELGPLNGESAVVALEQCMARLELSYLRERQEGLLATDEAALPPGKEIEEAIVSANTRLKELFSQRGQ